MHVLCGDAEVVGVHQRSREACDDNELHVHTSPSEMVLRVKEKDKEQGLSCNTICASQRNQHTHRLQGAPQRLESLPVMVGGDGRREYGWEGVLLSVL